MYAIEKNVPAPPAAQSTRRYPFPDMEVGDSFFVQTESARTNPRLRSCAALYGKRHGKKFRVRSVDGGSRVWRIA